MYNICHLKSISRGIITNFSKLWVFRGSSFMSNTNIQIKLFSNYTYSYNNS